MIDLGTVKPGSTIRIPFASYTGSTGASSALSNFAVGDILIYKDGGTTARASTTGFTATTSFSSVTGINLAIIDLSSDATAGFFSAGSEYFVVISPVTIDSQTVALVAARFTIGFESAFLNTTIATLSSQTSFTLTAGPAEDSALVGCICVIHDVASAVQEGTAVVSAYTGSTKTVTLTAGTTFTAAASDNISFWTPANTRYFGGASNTIVSGVPQVNVAQWNGTNVSSPATAGVPDVNVKAINNVATTSVATVNANIGLTQPLAFTGTGSSALAKVDTQAISTDTAAADNLEAILDGTGGVNLTVAAFNLTALTVSSAVNFGSVFNVASNVSFGAGFAITGAYTATSASNDVRINGVVPGASGGLHINGSNSGTTTFAAFTITGAFTSTSASNDVRVNCVQWIGTAISAPIVAGLPDVNVRNLNNVSASSIATINANLGTTQPVNFSGSGSSAYVKTIPTDVSNIVTGGAIATSGGAVLTVATVSAISGLTIPTLETVSGRLNTMINSTPQFTVTALANGPGGGGTAQAVWDILTSLLVVPGSIGEFVLSLNAGSGTGSQAITVTVTSSVTPFAAIQNAVVRFTENGNPSNTFVASTNVSGIASFSLNPATYTLTITKDGFQFTPATQVVTTATNIPKSMTPVAIPPAPANPSQCTVYGYLLNLDGTPGAGLTLTATLDTGDSTQVPTTAGGSILVPTPITATSDVNGYVEMDVFLSATIEPDDSVWMFSVTQTGYSKSTTVTGSTLNLNAIP